jgi:hypothetical protein
VTDALGFCTFKACSSAPAWPALDTTPFFAVAHFLIAMPFTSLVSPTRLARLS